MIDLTEVKRFMLDANMPHATGGAELVSEEDGSRSITFAKGDWSMHDNFFGGEPYGGRQVVFFKNKPAWLCVYYGRFMNIEPKPAIYNFLRKALQFPPEDSPYRGPLSYKKGSMEYKNTWKGEADNFSGHEEIFEDGIQVYQATYLGGLIDQRARGSL